MLPRFGALQPFFFFFSWLSRSVQGTARGGELGWGDAGAGQQSGEAQGENLQGPLLTCQVRETRGCPVTPRGRDFKGWGGHREGESPPVGRQQVSSELRDLSSPITSCFLSEPGHFESLKGKSGGSGTLLHPPPALPWVHSPSAPPFVLPPAKPGCPLPQFLLSLLFLRQMLFPHGAGSAEPSLQPRRSWRAAVSSSKALHTEGQGPSWAMKQMFCKTFLSFPLPLGKGRRFRSTLPNPAQVLAGRGVGAGAASPGPNPSRGAVGT